MKQQKLFLYVWENFNPSYEDGLAFAIASSEREAKGIITNLYSWEESVLPIVWGPVQVRPISKTGAYCDGGS